MLAGCCGLLAPAVLQACPFCNPIQPTLQQRREAAGVVALAEMVSAAEGRSTAALRVVHQGKNELAGRQRLTLRLPDTAPQRGLCLLFGEGQPGEPLTDWRWEAVAVNEVSYAYFVRSPSLRQPADRRLAYFVRYLEHADPLIAEDAYGEFGQAPFEAVAANARHFSMAALRRWVQDPGVLPRRKGFYAMALGLAAGNDDRRHNLDLLRRLVREPADDFREGFDGILAGYLLLAGPAALEEIETRLLADPKSRDGDVRHALSALRFYWTYGDQVPRDRLRRAVRHLLDRREFTAEALVDLTRWQDWDILDRVPALYPSPKEPQPALCRAVVAYLLACPGNEAQQALRALRQHDPRGVAEAEVFLRLTTGQQ